MVTRIPNRWSSSLSQSRITLPHRWSGHVAQVQGACSVSQVTVHTRDTPDKVQVTRPRLASIDSMDDETSCELVLILAQLLSEIQVVSSHTFSSNYRLDPLSETVATLSLHTGNMMQPLQGRPWSLLTTGDAQVLIGRVDSTIGVHQEAGTCYRECILHR